MKVFSKIMWLNRFVAFSVFLSVAANGVVGGLEENLEECSACVKGNCRSINGLYTRPDLPPGYSLVTQIPQGACRILIQQLKHTRNFIALRNANGSFIVNGDWQFSNSRIIEAAGTKFNYIKQDSGSLETITSLGPLANAVDIMIVHYHPNQGIKYGYALPGEKDNEQIAPPFLKRPSSDSNIVEPRKLDTPIVNTLRDEAKPPHRRTRLRRKFSWKITGVTACSKPCGGGIQTTVLTCVREHTHTAVLERRCAHLDKPTPQTIRCNTQECPPRWGGYWQACSGSCGQGIQHFISQCEQEVTVGRTVIVNDVACPRPKPTTSSRPCTLPPCENTSDNELLQNPDLVIKSSAKEWNIGPWSHCSVSCGSGHKTRSVTCPSGQCQPDNRPSHVDHCESEPCPSTPEPTSPWLLSEWSQCSEPCGLGIQSRLAVCSQKDCENKPETSRPCSSERQCNGQWFTGPWGSCSDSCSGQARQKREVICTVKVRGQLRITTDMTCPMHAKPYSEQACEGSCPPQWFTSDWGSCEGHCPNGVQRRGVKCMDKEGHLQNTCVAEEMPATKRPCLCSKNDDVRDKYKPVQDEPVDRSCTDRIRKCYLAVQARLCQYPYYTSHCCVSCKKAQQDLLE